MLWNFNIPFFILGAINVSAPDHFSEGANPSLLNSVSCSGMETEILECSHTPSSQGLDCDTAGVVCQGIKSSNTDHVCESMNHIMLYSHSRCDCLKLHNW